MIQKYPILLCNYRSEKLLAFYVHVTAIAIYLNYRNGIAYWHHQRGVVEKNDNFKGTLS